MPPSAASPRRYNNRARSEAAARTRDRILESFATQLGRPGATEVSVPEAAKAAGVSVRTIYHHFPDDNARRSALAGWIEARLSGPTPFPTPETVEDLVNLTRQLYRAAARHPELVRAQAANGFTDPVRLERLKSRRAAIAAVVAAQGAPPARTRRATAMIQLLMSAEAGLPLVDIHGLSYAAAAQTAIDTIRAIIHQLHEDHPPRPPVGT